MLENRILVKMVIVTISVIEDFIVVVIRVESSFSAAFGHFFVYEIALIGCLDIVREIAIAMCLWMIALFELFSTEIQQLAAKSGSRGLEISIGEKGSEIVFSIGDFLERPESAPDVICVMNAGPSAFVSQDLILVHDHVSVGISHRQRCDLISILNIFDIVVIGLVVGALVEPALAGKIPG